MRRELSVKDGLMLFNEEFEKLEVMELKFEFEKLLVLKVEIFLVLGVKF